MAASLGQDRLLVVDYIGNADETGKPTGHPLPALKQYLRLFEHDFQTRVCAPVNYAGRVRLDHPLPCYQVAGKRRGLSTLLDSFRKILNLMLIPAERPGESRLFVNIDINLAIYCLLRRKRARRWMVLYTLFDERVSLIGAVKAFLLRRLMAGMDLVLCSGESFVAALPKGKAVWIPDFFHFAAAGPGNPAAAAGNPAAAGRPRLLCVGTMNNDKDIAGLVRMAMRSGLELRVAGKFLDEGQFRLLEAESRNHGNIKLENRYLDEDEYDREIRDCSFVCLPYRKESYLHRTSGVLLEVLFRGKPVIAPDFGMFRLLGENRLGLNYGDLEEVPGRIASWTGEGFGPALARFLEPYTAASVRAKLLAQK